MPDWLLYMLVASSCWLVGYVCGFGWGEKYGYRQAARRALDAVAEPEYSEREWLEIAEKMSGITPEMRGVAPERTIR